MASHGGGKIALQIREAGSVVRGVRQQAAVDLLHVNCEGCEWEMLENLLKDPDVISKVPQVGTRLYKH